MCRFGSGAEETEKSTRGVCEEDKEISTRGGSGAGEDEERATALVALVESSTRGSSGACEEDKEISTRGGVVAGEEGKDEASRGCCGGAGKGREWERSTEVGVAL
jgi:hypothetical protein